MDALIRVDAARPSGRIHPHVYGVMFENSGRTIYDGLWVGEDSPIPNWRGFRSDVLARLREIGTTILRWPGGTPSETYHWQDGVGPQAARPRKLMDQNTCWSAPPETYQLGTDEYLALSREIGFEPYICVNIGTGSAEEAAEWVEYCNHDGDTRFAAMRAANGHPRPYGVTYWGIGNESMVWYDAEEYAAELKRYVKIMRGVDPSIRTIGVGDFKVGEFKRRSPRRDWNRTVLERSAQYIDYLSLHPYFGTSTSTFVGRTGRAIDTYEDFVACPLRIEQEVLELKWMIRELTGGDRIKIAIDEWQVLHEEATPENGGEQTCTLQDAIYTAGFFHVVYRNHRHVTMANLCNLVNHLPALVTRGDRHYLNPIYHAFWLYSVHAGPDVLPMTVRCDDYRAAGVYEPVPLLDCAATAAEDGSRIAVFVINRHRQQEIAADIEIAGRAIEPGGRLIELTGASETAANDFDHPDEVCPRSSALRDAGQRFSYRFPPHSVTLLELKARSQ